jgi:transcriptional regulator with PAS, ATPase and Fis domain
MVARFIHERSGRKGPFVAVNCAALPESLAEAELFGHSRGAFTGADRARLGYIRSADGGTLLLDEISDLPLAIQAKLLRVLEDSTVTPLGESHPVRVDLRVIAAGQKSLGSLVRASKFRGDLYARLNGLELTLPPLRARREEVPYIFGAVLREHTSGYAPLLQPQLVERLCLYDWPFNVRELVQVTRRIAALHGNSPALRVDCLPPEVSTSRQDDITTVGGDRSSPTLGGRSTIPSPTVGVDDQQSLNRIQSEYKEQELEAIRLALREHDGNVTDTAKALGISRQRLYRIVGSDPRMDLESFRRRR